MKKTRWKISAVGILQSLLFYLFAAGYKYTQRSKTYRQYNYCRHPLQNRSYRLISDSPENKTGGPHTGNGTHSIILRSMETSLRLGKGHHCR